jgi:hypothetical protein
MDKNKLEEISEKYGYGLLPGEPQDLPKPTLWPIVLAFGIIFSFWGFLTSLIITGVGACISFVALAGWIEEFK